MRTPQRLPRVELVVARYREDLRWTRNIPQQIDLTIYDKSGEHPPAAKHIPLPNVGREAHSYLHHIVTNYDRLAPITLFCQGHPFDHAHDLHDVLRRLTTRALSVPDFLWLGFIIDTDDPHGQRLFVNWSKNPEHHPLPLDRIYHSLLGQPCPPLVHFHVGAQFAVTAETVRLRPREFYGHALSVTLQDELAPHCLERIWDQIFGLHAVDPSTLDHSGRRFLKPIRRHLPA